MERCRGARPDTFLVQIWSDSGTVIEPDHGRNQQYESYESENMKNMQEDRIQIIQGLIAQIRQTT